jgi:hypothetical protein
MVHLHCVLKELYQRSRSGEEYLFRNNDAIRRDLRFLRHHGHLEHFNIAELRDGENLILKIRLTPVGERFAKRRKVLEDQEETKKEDRNKAGAGAAQTPREA